MVALEEVRAGNSRVTTSLPSGLVAVFAGATSGIGELALKSFAKYASKPRIYFIGRSQDAGDRIQGELKEPNPEGEYIFVKADVSLMKNVDEVCREIKEKEKAVNVLFMSQGTLNMSGDTSEGLRYLMAVTYYSRMRMVLNLLPLLQAAPSIRRVITTMSAGFEGTLHLDHISDGKIPVRDARPHMSSLITLALDGLAKRAPTVSFVHNYPGAVKTNLIRPEDGVMMWALGVYFRWSLRNQWVPFEEVGERHAWLCWSGMYPAREGDGGNGMNVTEDMEVVRGSDGVQGSGAYSIDGQGESTGEKIVEMLRKYREDGAAEKIWEDLEGHFKRITGSVAIQ